MIDEEENQNVFDCEQISVNELVLEILTKCNCSRYAKYFEGVQKGEFQRMTLQDIRRRFPGFCEEESPVVGVAPTRIFEELNRFSNIKNKSASICSTSININSTDFEKAATQHNRSSCDDSDSDDNYPRPSLTTKAVHPPKQIEEIDLGLSSDDEDVETETANSLQANLEPSASISFTALPGEGRPRQAAPAIPAVSTYKNMFVNSDESSGDDSGASDSGTSDSGDSDSGASDREASDSGTSDSDEPRKKRFLSDNNADETQARKFITISNPKIHLRKLEREGQDYAEEDCTKIKIVRKTGFQMYHNCSTDPPQNEIKEWKEFYKKFGPTITSIKLHVWSWKPKNSKCPFNLFKILNRYCGKIDELILKVGLGGLHDESNELRKLSKINLDKNLLSLKKIFIEQDGSDQEQVKATACVLQKILKASPKLEVFRYKFESKSDAEEILEMLKGLDETHWENLKYLEIRSFKDDGYLSAAEVTKLGSIKAKNLEELVLGNGIWEDVEGPLMEQLLRNFPNLKKLLIYGNYQGISLHKPDITIEIPALLKLEHLEIGGNYEFASVIETHSNLNGDRGQHHHQQQASNIFTVDDELKTELFSVTLKLSLLPNLSIIMLGNMYKIDDLHFSSLPHLSVFRVGSPWHLSVKFPPEGSRKNCYPHLKELQIPDCLKDESFILNLPTRFPLLEKCWVFLPSVKVLRTFFKSMANSQLKTLNLKTQFDFESTMETCLLGKPATTAGACRSWRDKLNWEELKNYEKFEEFVRFYNIELPFQKTEELRELEEDKTYAGLGALKSLKNFEMEHIPRVLRIPKGKEHWLSPKAEFTKHLIGHKKYPLSKSCLDQLPLGVRIWKWPNFVVNPEDTLDLVEAGGFQNYGHSTSSYDIGVEAGPSSSRAKANQVARKRCRGDALKVTIGPAMLQANFKFKNKDEKK